MAKIFALCLTLVALGAIAESISLSQAEETCDDCAEAVGAEEVYNRAKRANGEIIKAVAGLTHGILGISIGGAIELKKLEEQKRREEQQRRFRYYNSF